MTGLACWLLLIGVVDLVRGSLDVHRSRLVAVLTAVAAGGALLLALLLQPAAVGWLAWTLAAAGAAGWVLGSAVAATRFRGSSQVAPLGRLPARGAAAVAYGSLGLGVVALLVAGPAAGSAPGLDAVLAGSALGALPPERVLVVVAVGAIQVATVNVIVRLLLDLVGVPANDNEKLLRGGRVLGPMERLVILGLGAGGALVGAAIVVAAKAILRFPELRVPRAGDPGYGGPSDVTEYFLVGSFASWLVALGSVALVLLVPP